MKKSKTLTVSLMMMALTFSEMSLAKNEYGGHVADMTGVLQRFITNPHGDVDGFLLMDGTQVKFSTRMSKQLTDLIAVNDEVRLTGYQESDRVFRAEKVVNVKSNKELTKMIRPEATIWSEDSNGDPISARQTMKATGARELTGLTPLTAEGKVMTQLKGHRGDLRGLILNDGSIVLLQKRMFQDKNLKMEVGDSIRAFGYGTDNDYGKSFEATDISKKE